LKSFQIFKSEIKKSKTFLRLMFFTRPIQWYHSHADPIWPDGTFKCRASNTSYHVQALGWLDSFVKEDKFAAGNNSLTIADISLLATYTTIKATGVRRRFLSS
jgi:hypothetical protein